MKKIFWFVIILIVAGFGWYYRFTIQKYFKILPDIASSPIIQSIKQEISAPPPLIGNLTSKNTVLTVSGVVKWTNTNRAENGNLPALKTNEKLNLAAQQKVDDMFKQQYFEHENPQGKGPADLAADVHYEFISVGENLALGNFDDDKDLVTAWMNSPGHRANILNSKYTEIGVAVKKGAYEGKTVWLAVQEFGRPASDCPSVDMLLKQDIQHSQSSLDADEAELRSMKAHSDSENPTTREEYVEYNSDVDRYNTAVNDYNAKLQVLKQKIAQYNEQVNEYNACIER